MTHDPIDELARRYAPEILAAAVRQASANATADLTERLTRAMVSRAIEAANSAGPSTTATSPEHGLWAYVITRSHPLDRTASPEPGARLITHGELGLVVTEMDPSRWAELDTLRTWSGELTEDSTPATLARRHDAMVRAVFDGEPVLPLRFGTVIADEDAARRLLRARHDEVTHWLDRVDGHREWGVRAGPHAGTEPVEKPEPAPVDGMSGTEYLAMRQNQLDTAHRSRIARAELATSVHQAFACHATESTRRHRAAGLLLDGAYLVDTGRETAFRAEVERRTDELAGQGITVELTGPWPPYSFADLELSAELSAEPGRIEVSANG